MSSELAKWGSYDLATADKEEESLAGEGGGSNFMKMEVGKNVIRILPPISGKSSPFRVTFQHYVKSPNGLWTFTCPRMEAKKPCPLCQKADVLRRSGKPKDRQEAYKFQAKRRVFANVIDRSDPDAGPKVYGFGKQIHEKLVKLRRDEEDGGDFTHPIKGFDIVIVREGTTMNDTKYDVRPRAKRGPIAEDADLVAQWASSAANLDNFARLPSDDDIHEKLADIFGDEFAEEPAPPKRAAAAQGKSVVDAEFDDEDDEDDEDDDLFDS